MKLQASKRNKRNQKGIKVVRKKRRQKVAPIMVMHCLSVQEADAIIMRETVKNM